MRQFNHCKGKDACRDDSERCLTCGRKLTEVARTVFLMNELSDFVIEQDYDNVDEFAAYIARKLVKKVKHRREIASTP
ncbi:hypothetical protein J9253_06985 [Thiothrix litoralis]|uniref:Uncharacterized protein n=1 Tax=Thiothrix litoralis TaxID=2891210 RepID=A0ABX7WXC3_9GAMM|nr:MULTISPECIES: hypothetical protein [Thiothrix]QTR47657.1 hypothetical protein J9253_06985 [Thiothrix litoralis]WMP17238.1 hypothetical protein RCS87_17915 [Thiothrix lacustris]